MSDREALISALSECLTVMKFCEYGEPLSMRSQIEKAEDVLRQAAKAEQQESERVVYRGRRSGCSITVESSGTVFDVTLDASQRSKIAYIDVATGVDIKMGDKVYLQPATQEK